MANRLLMNVDEVIEELGVSRTFAYKLSTWVMKTSVIDQKILPYFRDRKVADIKPADIIAWQNVMLTWRDEDGKGYSPTYLKTIHNQCSAIFNHAVRYYDLKSNPAAKAGNMGKEKTREMLFWTKAEYHLHIVYIPVVEKQVLWTKRCKDPALVGTVKETIMQVSSSKKWLSKPAVDETGNPILQKNGKPVLKKSYSQLQDDFFNHIRAAGYDDLERGERGSTEEHLTVMQFKVGQEQARLEELQESKTAVESEIEREEAKLDKTKAKIQKQKLDLEHIEQIEAKPALLSSKVTVEKSDFDALKTAAQKYVMQEKKESRLQKELDKAKKIIADLTAALKAVTEELAQHKSVRAKLNNTLQQENAELKARIRWYDTIIDTKNLRELFSRYDHRRQQERQ